MDITFKLSKKSWHSKLMKYIWGYNCTAFTHMCPYFWLSVFNVLIIPFLFPFKLLINVIAFLIIDVIGGLFDKLIITHEEKNKKMQAYFTLLETNLPEREKVMRMCDKRFEKMMDYFNSYSDSYSKSLKYELKNDRANLKYTAQRLLTERTNENQRKLNEVKAGINSKLKFIKPFLKVVMYIIMAVFLSLIVYKIYYFIIWLTGLNYHFSYDAFIKSLIFTSKIIIGILGVVIISLCLSRLWIYLVSLIPCKIKIPGQRNWLQKTISFIAAPFVWVWLGICSLAEVIYSMYKNNCPPIDWE